MNKFFTLALSFVCVLTYAQDINTSNEVNILPTDSKYQFNTIVDIEASEVKSQGRTGTCWSFSATSFIESEIYRNSGELIDISEIYNVRATYSKKAWNYVMRQGKAQFSEGGLAHDVMNSIKTDGLVPESAYSGLLNGATKHDHSKIVPELKVMLDAYIKDGDNSEHPNWKKDTEQILDEKLGAKPDEFTYQGKVYTPKEFLELTGINPKDYVTITSFEHAPYYDSFVLNIPDNFSNGSFYNVPLEEFNTITKDILKKGYTIEWDGDVSEKTFSSKYGVAVSPKDESNNEKSLTEIVPEIEVTPEYRQQEFNNYNTTDDHLMHIIGLVEDQKGNLYYKIKNSWGNGENSDRVNNGGYVYMSEAFFKLKSVSIMVHKNALPKELKEKLAI